MLIITVRSITNHSHSFQKLEALCWKCPANLAIKQNNNLTECDGQRLHLNVLKVLCPLYVASLWIPYGKGNVPPAVPSNGTLFNIEAAPKTEVFPWSRAYCL